MTFARAHGNLALTASDVEGLREELTTAIAPISLLAWKRRQSVLAHVADDIWLMNAYLQLKVAGFSLALVSACADGFAINEPFQDVELAPTAGSAPTAS